MSKLAKRILVIALAAVSIFSFVFIISAKDGKDPKVILKVGSAFKTGHILTDTAEKFKELIEVESKGKISVQIEAGVDTEDNVNIRCSKRELDIQVTGGPPLQVFASEYFFFNAPYVIKDYDHFLKVWNGPLGDQAKALVLENGNMRSIGTVFRGYRQMTSNKPISGINDLDGLKLRLPAVPTWVRVWKALGTNTVEVPLTELYSALENGIADASEGDLTQIQSFDLNKVQTHIDMTNHLCAIGWVTINNTTYEELSGNHKKLIEECMAEATQWATQKTKDSDDERLQQLKDAGMIVHYPDADALRNAAKPAIEDLFKIEWPVTTWEEVLAQ